MKKLLYSSIVLLLFSFSIILFLLPSCKKDNTPSPTPLKNVIASPFTVKYEIFWSQDLAGANDIGYSPANYPKSNSNLIHELIKYPEKTWTKTITVTTSIRPLEIHLQTDMQLYETGTVTLNIYINGTLVITDTEVITRNNSTIRAIGWKVN